MNNKQNGKIAKASIVFYVVSVIFLLISAFLIYMTYETIVTYKSTYSTAPSMSDVFGLYINNVSPYFAYAFILYGIGVILKKFAVMTDTLTGIMDQAIVEVQEDDEDDSVFFDDDDIEAKDEISAISEDAKPEESVDTEAEQEVEVKEEAPSNQKV